MPLGREITIEANRNSKEKLKSYLLEKGLKASRQRDVIVDVFLSRQGHLSVEELLSAARVIEPSISQATVYRTMKLLTGSGLAEARHFLEGHTRYEISDDDAGHHDHLICTSCGKIIEFLDDKIEALQEAVAHQHGFQVQHHKMELYGLCADCQTA